MQVLMGADVFCQLSSSYAAEISASWQQCTADMKLTCVLEDKIIAVGVSRYQLLLLTSSVGIR
jgi:hypothetical protein